MDALRSLENIQVSDKPTLKGDLVDGLIVGMDMMARHCGTKKYKKRVFLITDGEREAKVDKEEMRTIVDNMNTTDTRLNVITLDFCEDLAEDDEDEDEQAAAPAKINPNETKAQLKNREFLV